MKLKIYQNTLIVCLFLLAALNIYFIVRTSMLFPSVESVQDNVILLVCLVFLLSMIILGIFNIFVSKKRGSTFIKPLAFDDDQTKNTKFIVFCYIFGVISIGVIVYFILVLSGLNLLLFFPSSIILFNYQFILSHFINHYCSYPLPLCWNGRHFI